MQVELKRILSEKTHKIIIGMQRNEITESLIYENIAKSVRDEQNSTILQKISTEEKKHYYVLEAITGVTVKPNKFLVFKFTLLAKLFGYTFVVKLMEKGEGTASSLYDKISDEVPEAKEIAADEERHEVELIAVLDEERLQYVGSMVLGLSDALVELTGTLAGLTFALQDNRLVALSGLITGISATLSMTSSEYLSARSDGHKNPLKSSLYTGVVYLFTVICLVLPYLLLPKNAFISALAILVGIVIVIILGFTYYISVAKDLNFKRRFVEMAGISLSVAAFSFVIGLAIKAFLGIDV